MCVPTTVHAGYQAGLDAQVEKSRKNFAHAHALVKNLESALAGCVEQPGMASRFPSQRKTLTIQLQTRLIDARLSAKRARADLAAQMRGALLVGATISSVKQIFPKVTLVIDSVSEEELTGPVRLVLDRDQLTIKSSANKSLAPSRLAKS
jgi:hypothetical protein